MIKRTLKRRIRTLCYVHGPDLGMIVMALLGAAGSALLYALGLEIAAVLSFVFVAVALCTVLSIVHFETKYPSI